MCPNCFPAGFTGFPSYWEFDAFEAQLQQKLAQRQLRPVAPEPAPAGIADAAASRYPAEACYHCKSCGETWALASPDNAWRGYFLPLAMANAYRQRLRRSDRRTGISWLVVLLALLGWLLWRMLAGK